MRDRRQTLFKTLTFALLHFGVAFSVTYALTGSVAIATGVVRFCPAYPLLGISTCKVATADEPPAA